MSDEKSLSQLLDEYNKLGDEKLVKQFGINFSPRGSFKDMLDATTSLEKLKEKIKASEEGFKAQEAQEAASPDVVKEVEKPKAKPKEKKAMTKGNGTKKATAKKAVKSKTPAKARGRKSQFSDTQKIHMIVKDNPRREGTAVYKQFEIAKKSGTVAAYVKAGGSLGSLRKGIKKKWLRVE